MTTTEPTTTRSPFMAELLEMLDRVREPDIEELTAEVAKVKEQLRPISERIITVLQNYENEMFWMMRAVNERYPELDNEADDGLHAFIRHAIGHQELWNLCQEVADMLEPDGLVQNAARYLEEVGQ